MKDVKELTVLILDYGTFEDLARVFAAAGADTLYYTPFEDEYRDLKRCAIGDGVEGFTRCDEWLEPDIVRKVDLLCVPDIGFSGAQHYFRSLGKAVWGSMGASDLELYRTRFLKTLKEVGLPVAPSVVVRGLDNLAAYLKEHTDKWVKVNRYRANMETWHHQDYEHSRDELARLAREFGGLASQIVFIVQDPIRDAREIGYDGHYVAGAGYPDQSFQGYEKKNELYLGSLLPAARLPDCVQAVNEAMAPVLEDFGYRCFIATEIRKTEEDFFFTDPTNRQAGQTMEHQYQTCTNLADVIWHGANGKLIPAKFTHRFAAEATVYHHGDAEGWKVLRVPEEYRDAFAFYHYCEADGLLHFPPGKNCEIGVVCGEGDSVEEAIESVKDNFECLEDEPVEIRPAGFADLIEEIKEAEEEGMEFGGELPEPAVALE